MTAERWTEAADGSSSEVGSGGDVVDLLSTLIRFDTTNWGRGRSAGERKAATWIADQLAAAGWSPLVLARDDAPERANVVLRVPGFDRDRPALLVHGHLDVVPAAPDDWSVEPFAGVVEDGYVWGRGAADMKDMCAASLATLLRWARDGVQPERDVVFAFLADEEAGGRYGAAGWSAQIRACSPGSRPRSARAAACSAGCGMATGAPAATRWGRPSAARCTCG